MCVLAYCETSSVSFFSGNWKPPKQPKQNQFAPKNSAFTLSWRRTILTRFQLSIKEHPVSQSAGVSSAGTVESFFSEQSELFNQRTTRTQHLCCKSLILHFSFVLAAAADVVSVLRWRRFFFHLSHQRWRMLQRKKTWEEHDYFVFLLWNILGQKWNYSDFMSSVKVLRLQYCGKAERGKRGLVKSSWAVCIHLIRDCLTVRCCLS